MAAASVVWFDRMGMANNRFGSLEIIAEAIMAERERCINEAIKFVVLGSDAGDADLLASGIAAAIRKGTMTANHQRPTCYPPTIAASICVILSQACGCIGAESSLPTTSLSATAERLSRLPGVVANIRWRRLCAWSSLGRRPFSQAIGDEE